VLLCDTNEPKARHKKDVSQVELSQEKSEMIKCFVVKLCLSKVILKPYFKYRTYELPVLFQQPRPPDNVFKSSHSVLEYRIAADS